MKNILLPFLLFFGVFASAQIFVAESFESTTTPAGWSYSGFSRITSAGFPCTGSAAIRRTFSGNSTEAYAVYTSDVSNGNAVNFSFNYSAKPTGTSPDFDGMMLVQYSVDGGANWTLLGTFITFASAEVSCANFAATVPEGVVPVNSNFQFRITGAPSGQNGWYLTIDDVSIVQTASCYQPANVTGVGTGTQTASVSWDPAIISPSNGYQIYYNDTGVAPTSTTNPQVSGASSPANLNGLNPSTTYYVWVRSACSATAISAWSLYGTFVTDCAAVAVPYYENFDSTAVGGTTNTNAPHCWSYLETSGINGYGHVTTANFYSAPHSYLLYNGSNYTTGDVMLVSPQTTGLSDGTNRVRFFARGSSANYLLQVGTLSDPTDPATFTIIGNPITLTGVQTEYVIDIPIGSNSYLAFRHGLGGTSGRSIYIDDIYVEDLPTCFRPSDVSVSNVTPNSLTISWTASNPAPAVGYEIYYSTTNVNPGNNPNSTQIISAASGSTSATIPNLSPGQQYFVWVRTICGNGDFSIWTYPITYTVSCNPFSVPYSELFDSTSTGGSANNNAPTCWSYLETPGSVGNGYVTTSNFYSAPNTYYLNNSSDTTGNIMLVSPYTNQLSNGNNRVRFFARAGGVGYLLEVGTMSNPVDPTTFTAIGAPLSLTTTHTEFIIDIPSGNDEILVFRHGLGGPSRSIYIDNVNVEPLPSCIKPANVVFSNLTQTSVTVSWTASVTTPANGYQVYYSTSSADPGASPTGAGLVNVLSGTTTSIGVSPMAPLSPGTQYYFWVRANCDTNDQSAWTLVSTITTSCAAITVPYTQNFDSSSTGSATSPNAPTCWAFLKSSGSTAYGYVSTTNEYSTPNNYFLYNASDVSGNILLVSPMASNLSAGNNRVRFYARGSSAGYPLQVGTLTDPADASTFSPIGNPIMLTNAHVEYTVYIPSGSAQILAFKHGLGDVNRGIYIDDIVVENNPVCIEPLSVTYVSSTDDTVEVSWSPSMSATVSGYEIYYNDNNVPVTPTTAPIHTGISGTSFTIPNLNPLTHYYIYVRSVCGTEKSV